MKNEITQEYLKECLNYNPETGIFTWKKRPFYHFNDERVWKIMNTRCFEKTCGSVDPIDGYISMSINNNKYRAHRLAFLYMVGFFPKCGVDHINRVKIDNRWRNLREASKKINAQNCGLSKTNTSGVKGVYWNRKKNRWVSQIKLNYKNKYLGSYKNFDDAVLARHQEEVDNSSWVYTYNSPSYIHLKKRGLI